MPRKVGAWTQDKLKVVADYLPAYLTATQKAIERVYIDAFAGPGANELERTGEIIGGSPLIALDARGKNGRGFDRLFFIESDEAAVQELRAAVDERGGRDRAKVIQGDVNIELPRLIERINKRSPTFVFLDPVGIDPAWETIKSLADNQTELLINFPLGMSINRNLDSPKTDSYFGTPDWRPIWETGRTWRAPGLIDLYLKRLADEGWKHHVRDPRLVKDDGNRNLYYLLFAGKVPIGKRIMASVFGQPDSAGQSRFRLPFPGD